MKPRVLLVVALLLVTVGGFALPANAATKPTGDLVIRKVDTSKFPSIELTLLKPESSVGGETVSVKSNDRQVSSIDTQTLVQANLQVGVVLAIDTSEGMKDNAALFNVKEAAKAMVEAKQSNEHYAIVAFNGTARVVTNFTADKALLTTAIDALQPSNDPALWSGVSMAASMFEQDSANGLQPNIVIISGNADKVSPDGAFDRALSGARSVNAAVFSLIVNDRANGGQLGSLAEQTGGRSHTVTDPSKFSDSLKAVGKRLSSQLLVTYDSPDTKASEINVELAVGNSRAVTHTSPGTIAEGDDVATEVISKAHLPGFLSGPLGVGVVAIVVLLAVVALLYGLLEVFGNERNQLSRALRPYSDAPADDGERDFSKLADSEIIKKAIASTGRLAQDRGLLQFVQSKLEQADLPLRPAEALFFNGIVAFVAMIAGAALKGFLGLALAGLLFAYLPLFITNLLAKRRKKKFTSQLPDTLQLLAGSLRAGYSLVQGLDAVAKQCEAPMGTELQRAMSEARLGRPVEEALQEISDRMASDDFEWAVMAIKIQREVGGNLAELLVTVGETMIARERLRREVRALTAEGRISAIVLVLLPFAIGGVITVLNPQYMQPLFSNTIGQIALVAAVIGVGTGYFVMNKLIEIEA